MQASVSTFQLWGQFADIFVILKPVDQWETVSNKEELISEMKSAVEIIPGVNFEFSQPIEMRFNELITGVREDVAIKLYGDDLDILAEKVAEIEQLIAGIDGIGEHHLFGWLEVNVSAPHKIVHAQVIDLQACPFLLAEISLPREYI